MATTTTGDTTVPTVKKRTLSKPNKQVAKGKPIRAKKGTGNNPRPKTPTKGPGGPFKGTQARARQQGPGAGPPAGRTIPAGMPRAGMTYGTTTRPQGGRPMPNLAGGGGKLGAAMKAFSGGGGTAGGFGGAKAPPASAFQPKTNKIGPGGKI